MFVVHTSMCVVHTSMFVVCISMLVVHTSMFVVHTSMFVAHHTSMFGYRLLLSVLLVVLQICYLIQFSPNSLARLAGLVQHILSRLAGLSPPRQCRGQVIRGGGMTNGRAAATGARAHGAALQTTRRKRRGFALFAC